MMALADGYHACFLFELVFITQLPEDIRIKLATDKFEDPMTVAEKADALWVAKLQAHTSVPTIHKLSKEQVNLLSAIPHEILE